jgi:VWFA-related protein
MKTQPFLSALLAAYLGAITLAQQPASSIPPNLPKPQSQRQEDEVVRITTNLVQVDAVITDKDGNAVIDLKPEEVQIYEDGRRRELTHFSYNASAGDGGGAPPGNKSARTDKNSSAPMPRLRPEDTRRTIAIVVDDLGLSFQSVYFVRRAIKKFVDEQMHFGDLVAIVRTSGGIGALQQFTSDKRQLYAAIEHIKWYASGRSGIGAFAPIKPPTPGRFGKDIDEKNQELEDLRDDIFSVGTLGAVSYVVRGLRELPGRKSVLLISDGFRITDAEKTTINHRTLQRLEQLIDQASRASVVIYTMNGAGLQTLSSITAEDSMADNNRSGARTPDQVAQLLECPTWNRFRLAGRSGLFGGKDRWNRNPQHQRSKRRHQARY